VFGYFSFSCIYVESYQNEEFLPADPVRTREHRGTFDCTIGHKPKQYQYGLITMASWTIRATMKSIPPNVHVVEDYPQQRRLKDQVETRNVSVSPSIIRPKPLRLSAADQIKPVAVKVVRPIPQRASEQFYNDAYREGITNLETSEATVMAHEWHRKWTQQEETHHDYVDQDFYEHDSRLPSYYAAHQDRAGANNPFMKQSYTHGSSNNDGLKRFRADQQDTLSDGEGEDNLEALYFNPEDRLSSRGISNSVESSSIMFDLRQVKRRNLGGFDHSEEPPEQTQPLPSHPAVRPVVVRPLVIRSSRTDLIPAHEYKHGCVPEDITAFRNEESVSPISCFSELHSDQHDPMTIVNRQEECVHFVEDEEESDYPEASKPMPTLLENITSARDSVLHALAVTRGDVDSDKFKKTLDPLLKYFSSSEEKPRSPITTDLSVDGMWLQLSKPTYFGCLGENDRGDPLYTLGRMAFDMYSPTNLICSLQGNFNPVEILDEEQRKHMLEFVPKALREEVESGKTVLRTYHIITAFTIEPGHELAAYPNAPNKDVFRSIKGIMTTYGYSLPDPKTADRHSIWFTGGSMEPNSDPADVVRWKKLFTLHPPKHTFGEKAKLLAVKLLMGATVPDGMDENGRMEFVFTRPLGGHGMAYVDVVYLDDTLRIVRGHRGTIMVFSRLPPN
jgi:hypothetical protein